MPEWSIAIQKIPCITVVSEYRGKCYQPQKSLPRRALNFAFNCFKKNCSSGPCWYVRVVEQPNRKEHKMAKNGWKLSKVAIIGSTRSLLAKNGRKWVLANQIWPTMRSDFSLNTPCSYRFQVHPFLAEKAPGAPVSGHCPSFYVACVRIQSINQSIKWDYKKIVEKYKM